MANNIIKELLSIPGLRVECPQCNEEFPIRTGKLFNMYGTYLPAIQKIIRERFESAKQLDEDLKARKKQLAENKKKQPARIAAGALGATKRTQAAFDPTSYNLPCRLIGCMNVCNMAAASAA
jgi:hypothetical protein